MLFTSPANKCTLTAFPLLELSVSPPPPPQTVQKKNLDEWRSALDFTIVLPSAPSPSKMEWWGNRDISCGYKTKYSNPAPLNLDAGHGSISSWSLYEHRGISSYGVHQVWQVATWQSPYFQWHLSTDHLEMPRSLPSLPLICGLLVARLSHLKMYTWELEIKTFGHGNTLQVTEI